MTTIPKLELLDFAFNIFVSAGVDQKLARPWAEVLVWANLRGTDSHGVMRIPRYVGLIEQGAINGDPDMHLAREVGAVAVLEADGAPGGPAMERAMDEAISRAQVHGIGWCSARNTTHAGAVGYFALKAARAGMAGVVMTASGQPLMAYHGARVSGLSTNPLAISIPAGERAPPLLDMSTSSVAFGKLLTAREQDKEIPLGWGIGRDGNGTTNPHEVETLVPLGGPKGSGLSFMIECLSSLAVGNPLIAGTLNGEKASGRFNGVALAVNLAALGDSDQLAVDIENLGTTLTGLPLANGVEELFLPGERGNQTKSIREQEGIPLANETWQRLVEVAQELNVSVPKGYSE